MLSGKKKRWGYRFLHFLFLSTRFSLALVSKLTADVFCTSLWRPPSSPGYIARHMYVHIKFMLQKNQPIANRGIEELVSCDGLAYIIGS